MKENCVIFDMDGVLIDSTPFHLEAWYVFAKKYNLTFDEKGFYSTFGMRNDEIIPVLFPNRFDPKDFHALNEEKEAYYREAVKGKVIPPKGLNEFIQKLVSENKKITIGSSGPRPNVELIIKELGLNDVVKDYVCGDDAKKGKPAPDIFLMAAQKMNEEPKNCVVIEDAVMGVKAAKAAGMRCIALTTTTAREALNEADLVVEGFWALL